MKFLIAVHNLYGEKAHLMPWKTVIEVAHGMKYLGHEAKVISLGNNFGSLNSTAFPINTVEIRKSLRYFKKDLHDIIDQNNPDLIFWPITWRESKKRTTIALSMGIPIVGWFPGGVYSWRSVLHALRKMPIADNLPYLIEMLCINLSKAGIINQPQFDSLIAMTQTTAEIAEKAGWKRIKTYIIPPGKENKPLPVNCKSDLTFLNWIGERPYFLFMGPPSKIRGVYELFRAFELVADSNKKICLVCLFRSDGILDKKNIKDFIDAMKHKNRMFCIWDSLPPNELDMYRQKCHTVIMPFLLVPSEIPLAIIETMSWGKPVIASGPSGTGNFVLPFGAAPRSGDINDLATTMLKFIEDRALYKRKSSEAVIAYEHHPDWEMVSQKWLKVAELTLSDLK